MIPQDRLQKKAVFKQLAEVGATKCLETSYKDKAIIGN